MTPHNPSKIPEERRFSPPSCYHTEELPTDGTVPCQTTPTAMVWHKGMVYWFCERHTKEALDLLGDCMVTPL